MTAADRTQAPDPYSRLPQVPSFELTSTGFADGDELPGRHGFAACRVNLPAGIADVLLRHSHRNHPGRIALVSQQADGGTAGQRIR